MLTTPIPTPAGDRAEPAMPDRVRDTLSWLAHLIDATITLRGSEGTRAFAQRRLGCGSADVVAVREELGAFTAPLVARALGADLRRGRPAEVVGHDDDAGPIWDRLRLEGIAESVPSSLAAAFPAGAIAEVPLVVAIETRWHDKELVVHARAEDAGAAEAYLQALLTRARGAENHLRGRCLQVQSDGCGFSIRHLPDPVAERADVVLPAEVWAEVDLAIAAIAGRRHLLARLGLGTNRGLLLHGPPGTGKSALCRALAAELVGAVTVVFCDARAVANNLPDVYDEVTHLAPALVVLEDLDLVIERRGHAGDSALHGFLAALDGAMSRHQDTVTLATTNHVGALDPAAVRAARFDRIVEVPLPGLDARAAILGHYLGGLGPHLAVRAIAEATAGASGADLRELARRGVLVHGEDLDTGDLLRLVREGGWAPRDTGLYL